MEKHSEEQESGQIYFIMSDQPDTCGYCGARLEFLEMKQIEEEQVFVNECLGCKREILMVEN